MFSYCICSGASVDHIIETAESNARRNCRRGRLPIITNNSAYDADAGA